MYAILSAQLCLTGFAITAVQMNPALHQFVHGQGILAFALFLISAAIEMVLICQRDLARQVPTNYALLAVFTMCQAFYFSFVTTFYPADNVLAAAGLTAGMTCGITAYAYNTKTDFTVLGSLFVTLSLGLIGLVLISAFMSFVSWWHPLLCVLLVVAYGLYLIYDTQLIAGGHEYSLTYDEYIVGAMLIYVDIMMLFIELLRLLGDKK